MKTDNKTRSRIQFLACVVAKTRDHLLVTDQRLFSRPFDIDRVKQMGVDVELAERVEAFVGRFGRLQDTPMEKGEIRCRYNVTNKACVLIQNKFSD